MTAAEYTSSQRDWVFGFLLGCGVSAARADEYAGKFLASFVEAVRREEREKAAQIAEAAFGNQGALAGHAIAARIREQGENR